MPDDSRGRVPSTATAVLSALGAGAAAAVGGTLLHAQLSYAGDVPIPWGSALALVFAGSLMVLAGLFSGRLWAVGVAGAVSYGLVAVISMGTQDQLLVPLQAFGVLPGPALAAAVWTYGLVAATLAALFVTLRCLPRTRRT